MSPAWLHALLLLAEGVFDFLLLTCGCSHFSQTPGWDTCPRRDRRGHCRQHRHLFHLRSRLRASQSRGSCRGGVREWCYLPQWEPRQRVRSAQSCSCRELLRPQRDWWLRCAWYAGVSPVVFLHFAALSNGALPNFLLLLGRCSLSAQCRVSVLSCGTCRRRLQHNFPDVPYSTQCSWAGAGVCTHKRLCRWCQWCL